MNMDIDLFEMIPEIGEQTSYIDSVIEINYPHIAKNIKQLWGYPEFYHYMEELLNFTPNDNRTARKGFQMSAIIELSIILEAHMKRFPHIENAHLNRSKDPWNYNY